MSRSERVVLAVDPGSSKCGVAIVAGTRRALAHRIVPVEDLGECVRGLLQEHPVTQVVVGNRTGSRAVVDLLRGIAGECPVVVVDEHLSSLEARRRYFRDKPPRGLWRWIPLGLQVPPCPVDDYVAIILAERYLSETAGEPIEDRASSQDASSSPG